MLEQMTASRPVKTVLVTRLDALGDIVLGTMLLWGLRAKWPTATIRLAVRPQFAAVSAILPDWVEVVVLPFDPRDPIAGHEPSLIAQLREFSQAAASDLVVVGEYNRSWASEIIAATNGAEQVIAFDGPSALGSQHRDICSALNVGSTEKWFKIAADPDLRESGKYQAMMAALGIDGASILPGLVLRYEDRLAAAALWEQVDVDCEGAIVCFPSSGAKGVRSFDPSVWNRWMGRLLLTRQVILFGAAEDAPVLDAIEQRNMPEGVKRVMAPEGQIGVTAAFLERAGAYIGMDTGPMHIAAALGRPTLGVFGGGHRADRFLPVGRRVATIRMPLGCYGCDWYCPFDRRLCIKDIPEWPLFEAGDAFLNDPPDNANPFSPRIYDVDPPSDLPAALLGPVMRKHRQYLDLNHSLIEHHAYLARINAEQQAKIAELQASQAALGNQNHERGGDIVRLTEAVAEMTRHNQQRDAAITGINQTLADMTRLNEGRDGAIHHINQTLAEMTRQNEARDTSIATLTKAQAAPAHV